MPEFRLSVTIVLIFCLSACGSVAEQEYKRISPKEALEMMSGEAEWRSESAAPNYFGGVPDDIVTPIGFNVTRRINSELPVFRFRFEGVTVQSYLLNRSGNLYFLRNTLVHEIHKLTVTDENGNLVQQITDLDIVNETGGSIGSEDVRFDDWNFDGYLDFSLPNHGFWSTAYFLWNNADGLFIRCYELELLGGRNNVSTCQENERLIVFGGRMSRFFENHYEYINGEITLVKSIMERHLFIEETEEGLLFSIQFTYYELVDGELVVVDGREHTEIWN